MFKMNKWILPSVRVVAGLGLLPNADAENPPCFTTASLQGPWTSVATYGANVALAFGRRTIEANGHFTGTFVLNAPLAGSTTGQRTISTGTQVGTYAVNCDGTGTVTRLLRSSTGVVTTQIDDLEITGSILRDGQLIATAMVDAVRVPSALVQGGIFVDRKLTRLSVPTGD